MQTNSLTNGINYQPQLVSKISSMDGIIIWSNPKAMFIKDQSLYFGLSWKSFYRMSSRQISMIFYHQPRGWFFGGVCSQTTLQQKTTSTILPSTTTSRSTSDRSDQGTLGQLSDPFHGWRHGSSGITDKWWEKLIARDKTAHITETSE